MYITSQICITRNRCRCCVLQGSWHFLSEDQQNGSIRLGSSVCKRIKNSVYSCEVFDKVKTALSINSKLWRKLMKSFENAKNRKNQSCSFISYKKTNVLVRFDKQPI